MDTPTNGAASGAPDRADLHDPARLADARTQWQVPAEVSDDLARAGITAERQAYNLARIAEAARLEADLLTDGWPRPNRSLPVTAPKGEGSGVNASRGPVHLADRPKPPPREWTVDGIVPVGDVAVFYGHGGLGKSYLVLYLAICIITGRPFFGLPVRRGPVLWVDRELDEEETTRRAYQVAEGLGLPGPPDGLHYLRPADPIGTDSAQAEVLAAIEATGAQLCVLDSLTLGSQGDAKEQRDIVPVLNSLKEWGTVLAIDHITKAAAGGNQSEGTPFGTVMKWNGVRSALQLTAAGDALALRQKKNNFGALADTIHMAAEWAGDGEALTVRYERVEAGDDRLAGAEDHAPSHEQTLHALHDLHRERGGPVPLAALADARGIADRTVRNHLSKLGRSVERHGDNTYSPAGSPPGTAGSEPVNGDDPLSTGDADDGARPF